MTYNVFSETLNPTQSIDSKQKIETLSMFLLSVTTQRAGGNGAHWVSWKTMFLCHSRSAVIYIAPIAIAVKRWYHSDSYLKLSLSQHSTVQRRWK